MKKIVKPIFINQIYGSNHMLHLPALNRALAISALNRLAPAFGMLRPRADADEVAEDVEGEGVGDGEAGTEGGDVSPVLPGITSSLRYAHSLPSL